MDYRIEKKEAFAVITRAKTFPCKGAMPRSLQDVNRKIYTEWLPTLKNYEFAARYYVEMYDDLRKYEKGT